MYFHDILHQLTDLRKTWKSQDFKFTKEQREQYEMLQALRRARVTQMYEEDMVAKPFVSSKKVETTDN